MNISFLCGGGGPAYAWSDYSVEVGIGGSEECLIYLARALAKMGHRVRVYNRCGDKSGYYHGVEYIHFEMPPEGDEDLLVAWRDWMLLIGKRARQRWMWSHDQASGCHIPSVQEIQSGNADCVDKFVLLTAYHESLYDRIPQNKRLRIPIGVNSDDFAGPVPERERGRVLYFSEPARGLFHLRQYWADVLKRAPWATLAAFWWDESKFLDPYPMLGILPMRHLGPKEVAHECQRASVFAYPSVFDEISPATTIKAQLGGAAPCVVARGGMVETVKYGVKTTHAEFAWELGSLLVDEPRQERIRREMLAGMQSYPSWDKVAQLWLDGLEWELRHG
jgi:glycosyltransferase involved in cell wall biosynthesis